MGCACPRLTVKFLDGDKKVQPSGNFRWKIGLTTLFKQSIELNLVLFSTIFAGSVGYHCIDSRLRLQINCLLVDHSN